MDLESLTRLGIEGIDAMTLASAGFDSQVPAKAKCLESWAPSKAAFGPSWECDWPFSDCMTGKQSRHWSRFLGLF